MSSEREWTLEKHGVRKVFVERGEMMWVKLISLKETKWESPQPKQKAREYWDELVKEGYTLV